MATLTPEGFLGMMPFLGRSVFMKRFNLFIQEKTTAKEGAPSQNLVMLTRIWHTFVWWCSRRSPNCVGNVKSGWVGKKNISQLIKWNIRNSPKALKCRSLSEELTPICHRHSPNYSDALYSHFTGWARVYGGIGNRLMFGREGFIFKMFLSLLCTYLAEPGFSCRMQDLSSGSRWVLGGAHEVLVVACGV